MKSQVGKQDINSDSSDKQNIRSQTLSNVGEDVEQWISMSILEKRLTVPGRVKGAHILQPSNCLREYATEKHIGTMEAGAEETMLPSHRYQPVYQE